MKYILIIFVLFAGCEKQTLEDRKEKELFKFLSYYGKQTGNTYDIELKYFFEQYYADTLKNFDFLWFPKNIDIGDGSKWDLANKRLNELAKNDTIKKELYRIGHLVFTINYVKDFYQYRKTPKPIQEKIFDLELRAQDRKALFNRQYDSVLYISQKPLWKLWEK